MRPTDERRDVPVIWAAALLVAIIVALAAGCTSHARSGGSTTTRSQSTTEPLQQADLVVSKSGEPGCLRLTQGGEPHEACLSLPGGALWRVGGVDYVVAITTMAPFGGEGVIPAGPSGFVVLTLRSYLAQRPSGAHDTCYTPAISDAVEATLGPNPPPFMVTTCSPDYVILHAEYTDPRAHEHDSVLVLARQHEVWKSLGTLDMTLDRSQRCGWLPDTAPSNGGVSARYLCSIVG